MKNRLTLNFSVFILVTFFVLSFSTEKSWAQTPKTLAVLPFEMIAPDDLSYIQSGTLQMLHSRLSWKDRIEVIDKNQTQAYLDSIQAKSLDQTIIKLAKATECDFVLSGTITSFADAFSVDTRLYDIKNKRYLSFSEQSKTLDDVVPKINLIAAKINKKVFQRETMVYENLVKQEKEKIEQIRRQNPEKLMPVFTGEEQEKKEPIWKIWKYL